MSGVLPVDFYGKTTGGQKLMGEQIKSCFRFLLSCAGLLCGLALAGPIIEELGYFLTSAASVIVSIPFFGPVAFRFCPFTTKEVESIESIHYSFISYPLLSGMSREMHGDLSASQAGIPQNRHFLPSGLYCGIFAMRVLDLTAADQRKAGKVTNSSRRA